MLFHLAKFDYRRYATMLFHLAKVGSLLSSFLVELGAHLCSVLVLQRRFCLFYKHKKVSFKGESLIECGRYGASERAISRARDAQRSAPHLYTAEEEWEKFVLRRRMSTTRNRHERKRHVE
uniref:DUF4102 domain-containing protein n=1 Tax=Ascaris lumbricoides TaxID=6252 RepID=A0A0M3IEU3_ASCLU